MLLKYYGVDWMAMVTTCLSLYYLGEKKRIGFIYGMLASCFWFTFGVMVGSIANCIANSVFLLLNIRGLLYWQHPTNENG